MAAAVENIMIGARKTKIANKNFSEERNESASNDKAALLEKIIIGIVRGKTNIVSSELFEVRDKIRAEQRLVISLIKKLLTIAVKIKLLKMLLFNFSIATAMGKLIIKIKQETSQLVNILTAIIKEKLWPEINSCSNQPFSKSLLKKFPVFNKMEKIRQNQITEVAIACIV